MSRLRSNKTLYSKSRSDHSDPASVAPSKRAGVKLKPYNAAEADALEIPLVFFSALERVQLDPEDEMHRIGDIIQLYEPGPLPALEPIMHVGFLSHV